MVENKIQISQSHILDLPQDIIWEKLNDPKILAACIRGCQRVEKISEDRFKAIIRASIGKIKKDFSLDLYVDAAGAPSGYILSSDVSAGMLGKAQGSAQVRLDKINGHKTKLHYTANINASGLLNKTLPLVQGIAGKRVQDFFDEFVVQVAS